MSMSRITLNNRGIRPLSVTPGRIRWKVPTLLNNSPLAVSMERLLSEKPGVQSVRANPVTARLLIRFDGAIDDQELRQQVVAAVAEGLTSCDQASGAAGRRPDDGSRTGLPAVSGPRRLRPTSVLAVGGVLVGAAVAVATAPVAGTVGVAALTMGGMSLTRLTRHLRTADTGSTAAELTRSSVLPAIDRRFWLPMVTSLGLGALGVVFSLSRFVVIGLAANLIATKGGPFGAGTAAAAVRQGLLGYGVALLTLGGLYLLCTYAGRVLWRNTAQSVQHQLRLDVYGYVQRLEMNYIDTHNRGSLLSILNEDINQVEHFFAGTWEILEMGFNCIAILAVFFIVAPTIVWPLITVFSIILFFAAKLQDRVLPPFLALRQEAGLLSERLSTSLDGLPTIRSFTAEESQLANVSSASLAYQKEAKELIVVGSAFSPLFEFLIVGGILVISVAGGGLIGASALSIGMFAALVMMARAMLWPVSQLGRVLETFHRGLASYRRAGSLLYLPTENLNEGAPLPTDSVRGDVVLADITFSYNSAPVLNRVCLHIAAGKMTGIVGTTGSGKTTIGKLLLRFYQANQGTITLDGRDLRSFRLGDLRRVFGLVSQDVFLLDGTVRENIALFDPDAPFDSVVDAAVVAGAHDFIKALPGGYDTQVGERGAKLSGGQRQRLAIARALLKDSPVLLLDEATSHIDTKLESKIQRSLEKRLQGKTWIIIAHRLSTVRNADRIYVLEDGEIIEDGRHEDLIGQGGTYASLWHLQTSENQRGDDRTPAFRELTPESDG